MKINRRLILSVLAILIVTALIERFLGRLWLGPDGKFGLFSVDIYSSSQSQRILDPYSFSHFIHGMLFFALLWPFREKLSLPTRFTLALLIEACWEVLENSPIIIDRYRAATVSFGYQGDSILNSISDIGLAGLGFWFARSQKWWVSLLVGIGFELFTLWWVRDNLILNIVMLLCPLDAIREWQSQVMPKLLR